MLLTLVVPCFNEEETLRIFHEEVTKALLSVTSDYELLLIDDGSKDRTLDIMKSLAAEDPHVIYFSFSRNFGKEAAMLAGFSHARGEYCAVMDADLQDPPSLLGEMIRILETGDYDSVATRRSTRKGEPLLRSWFSRKFYQIINRISDADITDGARDFRLMKRSMLEAVLSLHEANRFTKGIFGWVGFKTYWISYDNIERAAGVTKWNFWKLCKYALDGIISFSQTPLSIASWFGISITGCSLIALLVIIVRKLVAGDPVAGWASTICIIIFMGGIQLFCLGIMGQYIAKTYVETKQRPQYIIRETNSEHVIRIGR